jgi:hypothetical protein
MANRRTLAPEFDPGTFDSYMENIKVLERAEEGVEKLREDQCWYQSVGLYGKFGIDDPEITPELPNLAIWEKTVRETFKIPSERAGGKRSMGTGFKMPKTPKTYKHFMQRAVEKGVALLDADGFPRKQSDVKSDLDAVKEAEATAKDPEDKLAGSIQTFKAIRDKCAAGDARTIAAMADLTAYLETLGYVIKAV